MSSREKITPIGNGRAKKTTTALLAEVAAADVGAVISQVETFMRRFLALPDAAYIVCATWVVATHLAQTFSAFPYIAALSPVKGCGKTTLLEVLSIFARRSYLGVIPSPAALFRMAGEYTFLLDEGDLGLKAGKNISESQSAVLAILNAGYRKGATVPRCDGPQNNLKFFPVYGPKAFAAIGNVPETLRDRSVVIHMQRKGRDQKLQRFLFDKAAPEGAPLAKEIARWAKQNETEVRTEYFNVGDIEWLSPRDAEIWRALFAVCAVAEPERFEELKEAAAVLCGAKQADAEEDSLSLKLLQDIRAVWPGSAQHCATDALVGKLRDLAESPWATFDWSDRKMARALRGFDIKPRSIRINPELVLRGYLLKELQPAWAVYLSPLAENGNLAATPLQAAPTLDETPPFEALHIQPVAPP